MTSTCRRAIGLAAWTVVLSISIGPAAAQEVEVAARLTLTETPTVDRDGNVYFIAGYFIPNTLRSIMKVSKDGALSIYRENVKASSLLVDPQGRLIILGADVQGMPGMTRTDLTSGKVEVLIDRYEDKPFAGLNDLTMDGKGRIYFTDRRARAVYRVDAPGTVARILSEADLQEPNGIQVSPDDRTLYATCMRPAAST